MDSTILKLDWYVNIRSMQVEKSGKMWIGSESNCCKSKVVVSESISEPSFNVMSSFHRDMYHDF